MKRKLTVALMTALIGGVVIIAWIAGHQLAAGVWVTLGLLMVWDKLNRKYRLVKRFMIYWRERKKQKDLATFMAERSTDRVTKVK